MSDPIIGPAAQSNPAPQPPVNAPAPQAIDLSAITDSATAQAEKKAEAVVKSYLQQNGIEGDAMKEIIADWKSKQRTPEQEITERNNTILALQAKLDDRTKRDALTKAFVELKANPDMLELLMGAIKFEDITLDESGNAGDLTELLTPLAEKYPKAFEMVAENPLPSFAGKSNGSLKTPEENVFTKKLNKYTGGN